jgi:hypothetical protein
MQRNAEATEEVRDLLAAAKGAFRALSAIGIVVRWIGSLAAAFGAVVQYWFGSSSGSAHKNELLAASVPAEGKT